MKHGSGGSKPRGNFQNQIDRPEHSEYRDRHADRDENNRAPAIAAQPTHEGGDVQRGGDV